MQFVWNGKADRLDRVLRTLLPEYGRTDVGRIVSSRSVRVNSRVVWLASWTVESGARIYIDAEKVRELGIGERAVFDRLDPAWVIAANDEYVVLDKPSGLRSEAVRSADDSSNLLDLARRAFGDAVELAHRLDRDTSGLVVLTYPGVIRKTFAEMFRTHTISKTYEAIVVRPTDSDIAEVGEWTDFLDTDPQRRDQVVVVSRGGQVAKTSYRVTASDESVYRLELQPKTGRTHQLRVQCASRNMAILGDRLYGDEASAPRLLLHARALRFTVARNGAGEHVEEYVSPTPF